MNTRSKWIFVLISCLAVTVGCSESVSSIDDEDNDAQNQVGSNDESENHEQNDNQGDENANQGDENDNDESCESPNDEELCNTAGFECGTFETTDTCDVERTVDCGSCPLDDCESNMCGCIPDTCKDVPDTCGVQSDGCGGHMICDTDCENAIGIGSYHTCLMNEAGGVDCWGRNDRAQLGTEVDTDGNEIGSYSLEGVPVEGLDGKIEQVHAGENHSCAKDIDGVVYCWGYNDTPFRNQLTDLADDAPCVDDEHVPCAMEMTNLSDSATVLGTGGLHACAELSPGVIECWGANDMGQYGTGSDDRYTSPQQLEFAGDSSSGVQKIDGGPMNTCYLDGAGSLFCWGNNHFGQTGYGVIPYEFDDDLFVPAEIQIDVETPIRDFSVGGVWGDGSGMGPTISGHVCAISASGALKCWGHNRFSQLGGSLITDDDGDPKVYSEEAVEIDLPADAVAVAAGGEHSCAVVTGGDVYCWGYNKFGQLGNGEYWEGYAWWNPDDPQGPASVGITIGEPPFTNQNPMEPVEVQELDGVAIDIFSGTFHTCALMEEGDFQCWGHNEDGQLGDGTRLDRATPASVFDSM